MVAAFAYLRVSGLGQVDGDGFPRQLAACECYAAKNGLTIQQSFRDEGVTGKSDLDNRPALRECIAALLANGTRTLLIEKLDRLARDLMIQEAIVQDLQRRGISLISVAEPDLCSSDPSRTLMRQMMGAFFEYERKMIVLKTRAAREKIRGQGDRCEGVKPYGTFPGENAAIARMEQLRAEGASFARIAADLDARHTPTRSGHPWRASTVCQILSR